MKHFTHLAMVLCMTLCGAHNKSNATNIVELPDTVITTIPNGTVKHYYANNYIFCNEYGALLPQLLQDFTADINKLTTITPANAEYYDLQGHKISSPTKGINIVRQVDGKVVKMIKR